MFLTLSWSSRPPGSRSAEQKEPAERRNDRMAIFGCEHDVIEKVHVTVGHVSLLYGCRPLRGLAALRLSRSWGSRPRLYACACLAGFK
jgi:hypothetical protein